jgi:hypothetical protein
LEDIDLQRAVIADRFAGAVSLEAAVVRGEQLKVGYDPEPTNICHGQIWGNPSNRKRRRLLKSCAWYIEIPEVSLRDE